MQTWTNPSLTPTSDVSAGQPILKNTNSSLLTSFSGTSAPVFPAGTVDDGRGSFWHDNTNNVLKIKNQASTYVSLIGTKSAPVFEVTAAYQVVEADFGGTIKVNATSGALTITLVSAATLKNGFKITIKKVDNSANNVTIDPAGSETIDGATTLSLVSQYQSVTIISDGTNWIKETTASFSVEGDSAPKLGGNLDVNGKEIINNHTGTPDITLRVGVGDDIKLIAGGKVILSSTEGVQLSGTANKIGTNTYPTGTAATGQAIIATASGVFGLGSPNVLAATTSEVRAGTINTSAITPLNLNTSRLVPDITAVINGDTGAILQQFGRRTLTVNRTGTGRYTIGIASAIVGAYTIFIGLANLTSSSTGLTYDIVDLLGSGFDLSTRKSGSLNDIDRISISINGLEGLT